VYPVPDGSCDLTAHVALDSVAEAGAAAGGVPPMLLSQRAALQALGVTGDRPPWDLAKQNPEGYVRALAGASVAAELIDPDGLGGHYWLLQGIGMNVHTLGMTIGHTTG
jgi:SAM-dependent MidA family methyltransferase